MRPSTARFSFLSFFVFLLCCLASRTLAQLPGEECPCHWQNAVSLSALANSDVQAIAAYDFNGDSHADLLAGGYDYGQVDPAFYHGDGTGSFTKRTDFEFNNPGTTTVDIELVFIDDNDAVDILLASSDRMMTFVSSNKVYWEPVQLIEDTGFPRSEYTKGMAAGRLSNDAYVDVVEANTQNGNFIHWGMQYTPEQEYCWEAQGGSWDSVGSNGVDVQLHDINNDGYDDVFLLANNFLLYPHENQNWEVVVALNNDFSNLGYYFFTSLPAGSYNHLYLGDFNEDGMQDLYVTCTGCRDLVLIGRNGGKNFDLEFVSDGSDDSRGAIILDANNDQHLDIFVIKHNKANVLLLGDGEGNFIASTLVNSTKYFGGLAGASADFNEDGAPDFVVTNASPNPALLFLSTCECPPSSSSSSEEEPASSSSSESVPEEASSSSGSEVVADGVIDDSEEESSNGDDSSLDIDDGVIPTDGSSDSSSSSSSSSNVAGRNGEDDGDDGNSSMTIGLGVGLPILLLLLLGAIIVVAFFVLRARKIAMTRASVIGASDEEIEEGRSIYASTDSLISTSGAKEKAAAATAVHAAGAVAPQIKHLPAGGVSWAIQYADLEFLEEVGKGAFGVVWKGKWRGSTVAIKKLGLAQEDLKALQGEIEIMQTLRPHANVVQLMGVCIDSSSPYLVTEYMPKGDLRHFLHSAEGKSKVDEAMMIRMAREIAAGMCHLHSEGITHRDLAARNLLLTNECAIKVSDFGLSRRRSEESAELEEQTTVSTVGPLKWMAPESILNHTYSPKSDVWSYGIVLWEIVTHGKEPYKGLSPVQTAITVAERRETLEIPNDAPEVLQQIMQDCWQFEAKDRPTFQELLDMLPEQDS